MNSLFVEKKNCCGCTTCVNICPRQAITMQQDNNGFYYPVIDNNLCIGCGLCKIKCAFQNIPVATNEPIATYVAINKNNDDLLSSASGGVFSALSEFIFAKNGVVFGCSYDEDMNPTHICADNQIKAKKIRGSKYAQSNINFMYFEAKKHLENGRWVLFTGTPCQIAGLKSYVGNVYDNLITADIICHGVPSASFFKDYTRHLEDKYGGRVISINFRDKSKGWGHIEKITYEKNGILMEKTKQPYDSYYHNYFLKGYISRDSCYICKYACGYREGDFTMGDYWGIEKAHKEIDTTKGVSVLLVNSMKGISLIKELTKYLDLTKSTFEQARACNSQLNGPLVMCEKRDIIFKIWHEGGYQSVADEYYKENKMQIIICKAKMLILKVMKQFIIKII